MSLAITRLVKAYGPIRVTDDVSFTVPDGGLVGLIGPNGAGKSTLFSLVTGFLAPDSGTVALDGRALDRAGPAERARRGLVRTFQVPREFSHLTVRDNLMAAAPGQAGESLSALFLRPGRVRREEEALRRRVEELMAFLKLDRVAEVPAVTCRAGRRSSSSSAAP